MDRPGNLEDLQLLIIQQVNNNTATILKEIRSLRDAVTSVKRDVDQQSTASERRYELLQLSVATISKVLVQVTQGRFDEKDRGKPSSSVVSGTILGSFDGTSEDESDAELVAVPFLRSYLEANAVPLGKDTIRLPISLPRPGQARRSRSSNRNRILSPSPQYSEPQAKGKDKDPTGNNTANGRASPSPIPHIPALPSVTVLLDHQLTTLSPRRPGDKDEDTPVTDNAQEESEVQPSSTMRASSPENNLSSDTGSLPSNASVQVPVSSSSPPSQHHHCHSLTEDISMTPTSKEHTEVLPSFGQVGTRSTQEQPSSPTHPQLSRSLHTRELDEDPPVAENCKKDAVIPASPGIQSLPAFPTEGRTQTPTPQGLLNSLSQAGHSEDPLVKSMDVDDPLISDDRQEEGNRPTPSFNTQARYPPRFTPKGGQDEEASIEDYLKERSGNCSSPLNTGPSVPLSDELKTEDSRMILGHNATSASSTIGDSNAQDVVHNKEHDTNRPGLTINIPRVKEWGPKLDEAPLSPLTELDSDDDGDANVEKVEFPKSSGKKRKLSHAESMTTGTHKRSRRSSTNPQSGIKWPSIPQPDKDKVKFFRQVIQCNGCDRSMHYGCGGISSRKDRRLKQDVEYRCPLCEAGVSGQEALAYIVAGSDTDMSVKCCRLDCAFEGEGVEEFYYVERVIGHSKPPLSDLVYLVKWLGYPAEESTWQRPRSLYKNRDLISEFRKAAQNEGLDTSRPYVILSEASELPQFKQNRKV